MKEKTKILVIYNCYPHYRSAVINKLSSSENYEYHFAGCDEPFDGSIKLTNFDKDTTFIKTNLNNLGPFQFQSGLINIINNEKYKGVIILGNPYILSYWPLAIFLRLRKTPFFFWTHGWIDSNELIVKKLIRNTFYKFASGLLLYGNRAKKIGMNYGFDKNKLYVINNSLDYLRMREVFEKIKKNKKIIRKELGLPVDSKILVCSARLTETCRFDLLIEAAAHLKKEGVEVFIILIGDGPLKNKLSEQAVKLSVPLKLTGACYDEVMIAKYYYVSDLAVSPGKVGLTAMHSLTYETPIISHDNFDRQMPEYEAIEKNITGDFFKENDPVHLAMVVNKFLKTLEYDSEIGTKCMEKIRDYYSPEYQVIMIEKALSENSL